MNSCITDLILRTLPDNLKADGFHLIETSRVMEEERLKNRNKFRRHRGDRGDISSQQTETQEDIMKRKSKAEKAALPVAIAKLIMEVWSPQMRRHAEALILQKAIEEQYLQEDHLKWVHVLEKSDDDYDNDSRNNGWVIENQDSTIIELIWNRFNIKEHFSTVKSHRMWIQRSYDRLKDFVPSLHAEIIERHDLSKFAFSQAIGYTLKWVHNLYNDIWKTACDLHLHNEPHHPQTWSNLHTPEEKRKALEYWTKDVCEFHNGCPYGIDIANLDLNSEDLAEPFLLESFIDMVGVEWERKKGQNLDISLRQLVYMDDKFLNRYSKKQHQIISNLMERIIASDDGWKTVALTEREKLLMTTVPQHRRASYVCQTEVQKKYEEKRLINLVKKDESEKNEGNIDDVLTEEMIRNAHDAAFLIMISRVVMEHWDNSFRKHAEEVILKKAIEDKVLCESHWKWIRIIDNYDEIQGNDATSDILVNDDAILQLLWLDFNLCEHFSQVKCHRYWIMQSYMRLSRFMPELPEEVIERHDLSKFALSQSIGYTLKWVHDINYPVWRKSCDLHLNYEPHHPQMWSNKHKPEFKQSCLESWLCASANDLQYGVKIASLDFTSEDMAKMFLLESLIDMVAIEWERNKDQKPDLSYTELIQMEDRFLSRYSANDKAFILNLMSIIKNADHE